MIYFDNAATTKYKPYCVRRALSRVMKDSANPGRSGHRDAIKGAFIVQRTRSALCEYLHATNANVVFTKNCTEAVNLALLGTAKLGGHVITTELEHNSVLRPLHMLQREGLISLTILKTTDGKISTTEIENAICEKTYLIAVTAMSNVTGYIPPLQEIGDICQKHKLLFMVDGAQGIGHTEIDLNKMHIDLLSGAGHKALHGAQGTGFLIHNKGVFINPIMYGGTGTESQSLVQPSTSPESMESGTLNLPGIAALEKAVHWTKAHSESIRKKCSQISLYLHRELSKIEGIRLFAIPNAPIVTLSFTTIDAAQVADILNEKYNVAVRYGLHCAPLALNEKGACPTLRISIDVNNTMKQAHYLVRAIKKIVSKYYPQ